MASPATDDQATEQAIEKRFASRLLDVLIRAAIVLAVAILCYRIFAPFLTLTVWALILAVTLYPLHRAISDRLHVKRESRRRCWCFSASHSLSCQRRC